MKYFLVIVSQNYYTMPDVVKTTNESFGTQKVVMKLVKGLGNYTFECGIRRQQTLRNRSYDSYHQKRTIK